MRGLKFVIRIGDEYFHWGRIDMSKSRWTTRAEATEVSLDEARRFVKDWKLEGAVAELVVKF